MRLKARSEHNRVALTVIYFLGSIAILATAWSGWLIHESVVSDNEITSASVALIGQMVSISTLALGALGAMLSSTSPKPPPPPTVTDAAGAQSTPVTVVNTPEAPANVTEQPAPDLGTPVEADELEPAALEDPVADLEDPVDPDPPARGRTRR